MRRKKGFTLTEILVTIAIIAVILLITVPTILRISKSIKAREFETKKESIIVAAEFYAQRNPDIFGEEDEILVDISTLISTGYLDIDKSKDDTNCDRDVGCVVDPTDSSIMNDQLILIKRNKKVTQVVWGSEGPYYEKTTQTCSSVSSGTYVKKEKTCDSTINYTKTTKACNRSISNYTKTSKTCNRSTSYTKKTGTCKCILTDTGGVDNQWVCNWSASSTSTVSSCTASGNCASGLINRTGGAMTSCTTNYSYSFGSSSISTVSSCTNNTISCGLSTTGQINVACTTNYAYAFGSATTATVSSCASNTISCDASTTGQTNIACAPNYTYGFGSESTSIVAACTNNTVSACNSSTSGQKNVACTPSTDTKEAYVATTEQTKVCKVEPVPECNSQSLGVSYVSSCTLLKGE